MIPPPTTLRAAARYLSGILSQIVEGASGLVTRAPALTPGRARAARHVSRILELCCLLYVRFATNPGYQPPLPNQPLKNDTKNGAPKDAKKDNTEDDETDQAGAPGDKADPTEAPERPERPERTERLDSPVPGRHLSTTALVAEITRQLRLAAKAMGNPLPAELEALCRDAIEAAKHLEDINHTTPQTEPPNPGDPRPVTPDQNPQTRPTPPKPNPTKTLEL